MDINRIAIVLHKAVLNKLKNDGIIPSELNEDQAQASYDCVYDILQESMYGKDMKTDKLLIQKEATLRSIQQVPKAIQEVSVNLAPVSDDITEENIQDLVKMELERRGMQDQIIGATPPPPIQDETSPTPTPTPTNPSSVTPDTIPTASDYIDTESFTPITPIPPASPPPLPSFDTTKTQSSSSRPYFTKPQDMTPPQITTVISSPENGSDGIGWEFNTKHELTGITMVRLPHLLAEDYPFLLLKITTEDKSLMYPIIHSSDDWFDIPNGNSCLGAISGKIKIIITTPSGEIIPTRYSRKEASLRFSGIVHSIIDPDTGIAIPLEDEHTHITPSQTVDPVNNFYSQNLDKIDEEENEDDSTDGEHTSLYDKTPSSNKSRVSEGFLLFEEHSIVVFFNANA